MTVYYYQNVNGCLFILEKILIVALHLFARDGYETVYVSRIAGELDMTKGALYRHNKRKREAYGAADGIIMHLGIDLCMLVVCI